MQFINDVWRWNRMNSMSLSWIFLGQNNLQKKAFNIIKIFFIFIEKCIIFCMKREKWKMKNQFFKSQNAWTFHVCLHTSYILVTLNLMWWNIWLISFILSGVCPSQVIHSSDPWIWNSILHLFFVMWYHRLQRTIYTKSIVEILSRLTKSQIPSLFSSGPCQIFDKHIPVMGTSSSLEIAGSQR